jgi:hypothetical protein
MEIKDIHSIFTPFLGLETRDIVSLIIAVVGSGGFVGGLYALLKLRPEAGQITVEAAQGAIIVQTGVIETLRVELKRLLEENAYLRSRLVELEKALNDLSKRVEHTEHAN